MNALINSVKLRFVAITETLLNEAVPDSLLDIIYFIFIPDSIAADSEK